MHGQGSCSHQVWERQSNSSMGPDQKQLNRSRLGCSEARQSQLHPIPGKSDHGQCQKMDVRFDLVSGANKAFMVEAWSVAANGQSGPTSRTSIRFPEVRSLAAYRHPRYPLVLAPMPEVPWTARRTRAFLGRCPGTSGRT